MLMLNFFENFWSKIYNVDVAWYVVVATLILAILCMTKMIRKKNDKIQGFGKKRVVSIDNYYFLV